MGKVSNCDGVLFLDSGEEWALVVDLEVKNTVLIWKLEACGICLRLGSGS